jgi:hypothetical protein
MATNRDADTAPSGVPELSPLHRGVLLSLVAAKLLVQLPSLWRYGYFRDELYFLDCARHLDWGYVDHAPLVGLYAKVALLFGGSLPALRVLPWLAGAGLVALTVLFARQLGGGRWAQLLAGVAVIIAPVNLMIDSILSMNAFEPLLWVGAAYVLVRIVRSGDSRLWPAFGALAGLGLENKHSMLFFGAAVAVGILLTPLRRELAKPWLWLGLGLALLLFLPNVLWQWTHGFPTLEDLRNVRESGKNVVLSPLPFMGQQILMMHPVALPIWLAGLWSLLAGRGRSFRVLGWTYLTLLATMMALHGKDYYLAPAYPMLLAAGAVAVEGWLGGTAPSRRGLRWARAAIVAAVTIAGAAFAPIALPLLSPAEMVAYQQRLGIAPEKTEVAHIGPLPQLWGDQFGWPELVADVATVYRSLPAEERARTAIFASNYGEAGALNLFGPAAGLPPPLCAHQTHFFWGSHGFTGDTFIWLQWPRRALERMFTSVEEARFHSHPWGMAEENRPIYVCRGLRIPMKELWPRLKHWN